MLSKLSTMELYPNSLILRQGFTKFPKLSLTMLRNPKLTSVSPRAGITTTRPAWDWV